MSALGTKLRKLGGGLIAFFCPGCKESHTIRVSGAHAWGFNESGDAPTFTPSVLVTGVQCVNDEHGNWTGEWVRDADGKGVKQVCHSFVTDGRIQFLGDCTHDLAGHTVDLPDFPAGCRV